MDGICIKFGKQSRFFWRSFVYCWITNKLASENNNIPDKNSMVNFGQMSLYRSPVAKSSILFPFHNRLCFCSF